MSLENLEEFALVILGVPLYEAHVAKAGHEFAGATLDNIIEIYAEVLDESTRRIGR